MAIAPTSMAYVVMAFVLRVAFDWPGTNVISRSTAERTYSLTRRRTAGPCRDTSGPSAASHRCAGQADAADAAGRAVGRGTLPLAGEDWTGFERSLSRQHDSNAKPRCREESEVNVGSHIITDKAGEIRDRAIFLARRS